MREPRQVASAAVAGAKWDESGHSLFVWRSSGGERTRASRQVEQVEVETGRVVRTFEAPYDLDLSENSRWGMRNGKLAAMTHANGVIVWDMPTGRVTFDAKAWQIGTASAIALSPDATRLVTATPSGPRVGRLCDAYFIELRSVRSGDELLSAAISQDGRFEGNAEAAARVFFRRGPVDPAAELVNATRGPVLPVPKCPP